MPVRSRLERLRATVESGPGPGSLLLTSLTNIRYLTGFTGSAGMLFLLPGRTVLLTDGRYTGQASEQIEASGAAVELEVAASAHQRQAASAIVAASAPAAMGLEAAHISWARQRAFAEDWFAGVELVATVGLVEGLRAVKDPAEVARIAEAARLADAALESVRPRLAEGLTEVEFGQLLDFEMRSLGATGPSFETIVAAGPNGAKPHHRPSSRPIGRNEPVVVDFGALVDGYCSDMTRTVWVDGVAEADLRRAVEVVLDSQAAGVAAVHAGASCAAVDQACREVIDRAGWGELFVHGTGHGVGLDIHEAPSVAPGSTDTLVSGHVVTVEPGVYLPGLGGVRIEDTVVVTDDGCRPLTSTAKDHT